MSRTWRGMSPHPRIPTIPWGHAALTTGWGSPKERYRLLTCKDGQCATSQLNGIAGGSYRTASKDNVRRLFTDFENLIFLFTALHRQRTHRTSSAEPRISLDEGYELSLAQKRILQLVTSDPHETVTNGRKRVA